MKRMNLIPDASVHSEKFSKNEIITELNRLDSHLSGKHFIILCGSASVILRDIKFRGTLDIDLCEYPDEQIATIIDQNERFSYFDLNASGVIGLLSDYEDRLVIIPLGLSHLTIACISKLDWIVSKLASPKLDDVVNSSEVTLEDLLWVRDHMHDYCGISINRAHNDLAYLIRVFEEKV